MVLAEIVGTVVSTIHHKAYDGKRIMLCQPLTPDGSHTGSRVRTIWCKRLTQHDAFTVIRLMMNGRHHCAHDLSKNHSVYSTTSTASTIPTMAESTGTKVGSQASALACEPTFVPVDSAIVGIVDAVDVVE